MVRCADILMLGGMTPCTLVVRVKRKILVANSHPPSLPAGSTLVSRRYGNVRKRAAVISNRPSPDLSPWHPEANPKGERGTGLVSSFNPNSCVGARARTSKEGSGRMPHEDRIVGID